MPPNGISPGAGDVAAVGGLGAGAGDPTDGMSPAIAKDETAHVKAIIINSRFMGSPSQFEDARFLTSERIEQLRDFVARCA
jgi:hypothetical protein